MRTLLYTRPTCWEHLTSDVLKLVHVPVAEELKLKNGTLVQDDMGTVMDKRGRDKLVEAFEEHKPDIFLFGVHFGHFTGKLMQQLREISKDTFFAHTNGNQVLAEHKVCWYIHKFRRHLDGVLTNVRDGSRHSLIRRWVGRVWGWHVDGFDPSVFTVPDMEPIRDCFFGGGNSVKENRLDGRFPPWSKFRYDLICAVKEKYDTVVRGGGWPFDFHVTVRGKKYFQAMQEARIILGTNHVELRRYYTKRIIYGGASGRLYMTRYIPGMEDDFENGKNMVWFDTVDEGLEMVDYYLRNDNEREELAMRQREHFVKHHSWEARLRELEKISEEMVK